MVRLIALTALALSACGSPHGAPTTDGGGEAAAAGDGAAITDAPPELFVFSSAMDAHLVAAEVDAPSLVCCNSALGCVTSNTAGLCVDQADAGLSLGNSFGLWITSSTGGISLTVQTQEPPEGFTGACLLGPDGRLANHAQLPAVCFSLAGNVQYHTGTQTETLARVAEVVTSDTPVTDPAVDAEPWTVDFSVYHFQVLMTCYPHGASGACPAWSSAVSRSCCDIGQPMQYMWTNLAHGFVDLSSM